MNYLKNITLIALLIMISSCNNDDVLVEESVDNPVVAKIGVKSFGRGLNSFDEGIRIFKTSEGYISFEIHNKVYPSGTYEGDSDIVVRKVNEEFELIEEHILDTSTYEQLNDVVEIEEGRYALISRVMIADDPLNGPFLERLSTPYIKIVNDQGEILESQPLGDFEPLNFYIGAEVTYQNGRFYVNIPNKNTDGDVVQRIIAFDSQLNELWKKEIPMPEEFGEGKIHVGSELYIIYSKEGIEENTWVFVLSRFNLVNGELIETLEYVQENTKLIFTKEIIENQNELVAVGLFIDSFGFTDVAQSMFFKINMGDWSQETFTTVDGVGSINNIVSAGSEFVITESAQNPSDVIKIDSKGSIIWESKTDPWGSPNDIIINTDGSIVFTGALGNSSESISREVMIGMFDVNGDLK